jgi:acetylornithine deacetylase
LLRGHTADAAIITEPTNLAIISAQGGSAVFRITITGRSAHACVREEGVSALEKFIPIHAAILEHERRHHESITHPLYRQFANRAPINFGVVRAGNWPSSVPETLVAEGRAGLVPGETLAETREALLTVINKAVAADTWLAENPPAVEWFSGQFAPAETTPDHQLSLTLHEAHLAVAGGLPVVEGVTYGADMRHFVNIAGIPCVMYGADDVGGAHAPDESVAIQDMLTCAKAVALAARDWCS